MLDRCLYIPTHYEQHQDWKPTCFEDPSIFGNTQPVVIEYCSGNGEWICNRAKKEPLFNWIAVEKRFDRAQKIWARLHRENIQNLFVVCGEGVTFSRHYVPKLSVSKIFVNFPDPWPKPRHAKHRLIRAEFLEEIEKILIPSGKAFFTTDDRPYLELMMETVQNRYQWKKLSFTTDNSDFGGSYFLDLWKKKGRTIYHLDFEVTV